MGFRRVLLMATAVLAFPLCSVFLTAWVAYLYFFRSEFPPELGHPVKIRLIHIGFLAIYGLGYVAWKLGLCDEHAVMRKVVDGIPSFKDKKLHVQDLQFEDVAVRLYQPKATNTKPRRGILFFHGGIGMWGSIGETYLFQNKRMSSTRPTLTGSRMKLILALNDMDTNMSEILNALNFVISSDPESHEQICRFLARESESVVVSVGYRLSPEYPYPRQFKDCLVATIHFMKNSEDYGVDPERIVISGDSLGGTFAAAVCQELVKRMDLPKVRAQILLYPFLQAIDFNLPSHQQNQSVPPFFQRQIVEIGVQYLGKNKSLAKEFRKGSHIPDDMKNKLKNWISPDIIPKEFKHRGYKPPPPAVFSPEIHQHAKEAFETTFSPLLVDVSVVRQLPEMFILTCEYDVLRDEGLLYKKRLEDEGVPVSWYHLADGFHGALFAIDVPLLSLSCAKKGMDIVVNFVKGL